MKHVLPQLPYAHNALEPHIDARTMEIHHTKHHQTYVDKLNAALEKHPVLFEKKIEDLLRGFANVPVDIKTAVRNHGGGHANHSLFWQLMTPHARDKVLTGAIAEAITRDFGSFEGFKEKFSTVALNQFGSGWAWLVVHNGMLEVYSTANQDSPLMEGKTPLLCLDIWEHAYYLHYQNKRADYIAAWWNVVNWTKVNELFEKS